MREAEGRAKGVGFLDDAQHEKDTAFLVAVAEEQGCCCHHGGKCSCALLRKDDDYDDDGIPPHGKPAVSKPRLETTRSDGSITVFANGHHKPVHRKNHAAHECGMPYKIPMSRSKTDHDIPLAASRSVDSLNLDSSAVNDANDCSPLNTQAFHFPRRLSKSEQASPKMMAYLFSNAGGLTDDKFTSVDFSDLDHTRTNESATSAPTAFPSFDPTSGVSDGGLDAWSAFPSADLAAMPDNNPFGVWPTNHEIGGLAQPALTAASSGTLSEIDEIQVMEDAYALGMPSIQENAPTFDVDANMNGGSPQSNRRSLPPSFFGNSDFAPPALVDEWPAPLTDAPFDGKSIDNPQSLTLNDPWQVPGLQPAAGLPRRPTPGPLSPSGRPISLSVGRSSAPSNDIMRQLFPDMDLDGNSPPLAAYRPTPASFKPQAFPHGLPLEHGGPNNGSSGDINESRNEFAPQSWDDGSMSVPNDPFPEAFDFDEDYTSPDFATASWTQ